MAVKLQAHSITDFADTQKLFFFCFLGDSPSELSESSQVKRGKNKNKKKAESEALQEGDTAMGMDKERLEKMPPATLVAHMVTAMLMGSGQDNPLQKEVFGCVKRTLWMPESPPEGMLCSKLDDDTRMALANGIKRLIKQEMKMPVDKEIFANFMQAMEDVMHKQYTLWILPFDKETVTDMIDDIIDAVDEARQASKPGSEDIRFYDMIKAYLESVLGSTKEDAAKVIARFQGQ